MSRSSGAIRLERAAAEVEQSLSAADGGVDGRGSVRLVECKSGGGAGGEAENRWRAMGNDGEVREKDLRGFGDELVLTDFLAWLPNTRSMLYPHRDAGIPIFMVAQPLAERTLTLAHRFLHNKAGEVWTGTPIHPPMC